MNKNTSTIAIIDEAFITKVKLVFKGIINFKALEFEVRDDFDDIINRAMAIGLKPITDIEANCYIIEAPDRIKIVAKDFLFKPDETGIGLFNIEVKQLKFTNFKDRIKATSICKLFSGLRAELLDMSDIDLICSDKAFDLFARAEIDEVRLRRFDTSEVTDMTGMFKESYIGNLNSLISQMDTSKCEKMMRMFAGVNQELDLSRFNTSRVCMMFAMFHNYQIPEGATLDLSSFDTSSCVSMSSMFDSAHIDNLNISSFDTSKVENMQNMFSLSTINNLNLSNFKTSRCKTISSMFNRCNINNLDITSFDFSNITNLSGMFELAHIENLVIGKFSLCKCKLANNVFAGLKTKALDLSDWTLPNSSDWGLPNNLKINSLFFGAVIKHFKIKASELNKINDLYSVFRQLNVPELDLRGLDFDNVSHMDKTFNGLQVQKLILGNFKPINITSADGVFDQANIGEIQVDGEIVPVDYSIHATSLDDKVQIGKNIESFELVLNALRGKH